MKKRKLLISIMVAMFFATGLVHGQSYHSLPIYRTFDAVAPDSVNALDSTLITFGGWSVQSPVGTWPWRIKHYTTNYFVDCNGYSSTPPIPPQEQWLISPGFSTNAYTNVKLMFKACDKFAGASITVNVSTDYNGTGLPSTATWTDITTSCTMPAYNISGPRVWTNSGFVNLSSYTGDTVYVAFKYTSDATYQADWEVDSICILGQPPAGIQDIKAMNERVSIYPNPASSYVKVSSAVAINKIEVYDMLGALATAYGNIGKKVCSVNVGNLADGLYFAKIQLINGTTVTKKIITGKGE